MTFRKEHCSLIINVIGRPNHDIQERSEAFTLEFKFTLKFNRKIMHVEMSSRGKIVEALFGREKVFLKHF